jgi:ABC-type molybdate transport system substrate-binding protein
MKAEVLSEFSHLPVIPDERGDDIHNLHLADRADLIVFLAGNQFMLAAELMQAFQKQYPEVENIFYETLPPGLELKQILAGGAMFRGQIIDVCPDVYTSVSLKNMQLLEEEDLIFNDYFVYAHNRLSLMVARGNPKKIVSVSDLAREDVRVSQPDPEVEDIGQYIINMYLKSGGENLVKIIMQDKVSRGLTSLTTVHHRQTPQRIINGLADVGPVWQTEILSAQEKGLPVEGVEVGHDLDQHEAVNYYVCRLKKGLHLDNGEKFVRFLKSRQTQDIYRKYGFVPEEF